MLQIPNPLFDLAGITCGHFLVPFWTFFGATLIGKAIIKMHIQKFFVILAFNESLINHAVSHVADVPIVGKNLQGPFKAFLAQQKEKLHRRSEDLATATVSGFPAIYANFLRISTTLGTQHPELDLREVRPCHGRLLFAVYSEFLGPKLP